jgi:thermitase
VAGLITLAAPEALLLPIRVLDDEGRGDMWALTRGLFHAIDRGVEVINLSLSSTYNSEAVEEAIEEARELGIVTVAAAGNCDREEPREYPAMRSNIFGVAATDDDDRKADFSNYSDRLLLSAPGAMAFLNGDPAPDRSIIATVPGGGYAHWEGTSFAAPFVSGIVALVRGQHPEWPATESTFDQLEAILTGTAEDIDDENPQYEGQLGDGRIDAAAAVALAGPAPQLGDLDGNGVIDVTDILLLLDAWGQVHSSADLNGDGVVGVDDLVTLLGGWTT